MGIPVPVPGIRPGRPAFAPSILTVARPIPGTEPGAVSPVEWRSGVASRTRTCVRGQAWPFCPVPGHADKCPPNTVGIQEWEPFTAELPDECVSVFPGADEERHVADRTAELEALVPAQIARQLWSGYEVPSNTSLVGDAVDLSGGGVNTTDFLSGVGILLEAYATVGQSGFPTLHVPELLHGVMAKHVQVTDTGLIYGPSRTSLVSVGPGYDGRTGPGGLVAPDGYAWMFVSGPVEYAIDARTRVLKEQANARTNLWAARFQRTCLVRIEDCGIFGVLVKVGS